MHHASNEHPARTVSRALAERATRFCQVHLPHGHREGRFWRAGDLDGAPGRTVWVCLAPPGRPGRWQDDATGMRGDLLDLLRRRLGSPSLGSAIEHARAFLDATGPAPTLPAPPSQQHPRSRAGAALRLWNLCRPVHGSLAEDYLRARGLDPRLAHPSLRFHPRLFHRDPNDRHRELPALVAALTDDAGQISGVERIYLDPRAPARASVPQPCRSLGRVYGSRVALGEPRSTLLVAQGVETALALRTACPELPAAATLTPANFAAFTPPPNVSRLLVARDNDPASTRAAERPLARCRDRALSAAVLAPELDDFHRDLLENGPRALAERIRAHMPMPLRPRA